MSIATLVVDDEPIARHAIVRLLRDDSDIELLAECGDGVSAVAAIRSQSPDLVFLDIQMPAMSGIDVVASPPGKKLQNVLLLSGGEKALTALALLVGIFQYQPSPFCILDEVDAPLDEANVGRFTELVREMSVQTQFIIITHSKKTMKIGRAHV